MKKKVATTDEVRVLLDNLAHAEASPAFEFFKSLLEEELDRGILHILGNRSLRLEDEHDSLTRLRTYYEMLNYMPGKRLALKQALANLTLSSIADREKDFAVRNEQRMKQYAHLLPKPNGENQK